MQWREEAATATREGYTCKRVELPRAIRATSVAREEVAMPIKSLVAALPYLIEQDYERYTFEEHSVWADVRRQRPQVERYACRQYLEGFEIIGLQEDRLPNLSAISRKLNPRTGWSTTPVSGFLPADAFFEMLAARMFPTTTYVAAANRWNTSPEPDIFHDVFGHVPMHAHRVFADFLQHYGAVCKNVSDADVLERLGRLFWYTVEFGFIRQDGMVKFYGSGVISSQRESLHVIDGRCVVQRF